MLADGLLSKIGFTKEEEEQYFFCKAILQNREKPIVKAYMRENLSYEDAMEQLLSLQTDGLHPYTLNLIFFLECTGYLLEDYQKAGISEEIFLDSMRDFRCKLTECNHVKNQFGTFVPQWYHNFFKLKRFALGRLQYDISAYDRESTVVKGYPIQEGDFMLYCHIPSSGPLKPELCIDSLKRAYKMFQNKLKDGILVVKCVSWMLNPNYYPLFGEHSNLAEFYRNFFIISSRELDTFSAGWLIFDQDYDGDIAKLPSKTSLQKNFINYIKQGGTFGDGSGILLFDGERILTRNSKENE